MTQTGDRKRPKWEVAKITAEARRYEKPTASPWEMATAVEYMNTRIFHVTKSGGKTLVELIARN